MPYQRERLRRYQSWFNVHVGQDLQDRQDYFLLSQFPDETGKEQSACGGRGK
jgi:hypothetical protein